MQILEIIIVSIMIATFVFSVGFAIRFYYKILTGQDPFDFMNK